MIQANELRVNNAVHCKYRRDYFLVKEITEINLRIADPKKGYLYAESYETVTPIPLTFVTLEACGFDKRKADEDGEYWGFKNFTLMYSATNEGGFGWFLNGYHNDCHIEHIHQLQNLYFALVGQELTINLEQVTP